MLDRSDFQVLKHGNLWVFHVTLNQGFSLNRNGGALARPNFGHRKFLFFHADWSTLSHSTIISFLVALKWGFLSIIQRSGAILLPYYISLASSLVLRPNLLKWIIPNQVRTLGSLAYKTEKRRNLCHFFLEKHSNNAVFVFHSAFCPGDCSRKCFTGKWSKCAKLGPFT